MLAAKDARHGGAPKALVGEVADLWFHCLVMLSHFDLNPADVLAELERREGLSGIEEKALRKIARARAERKRRLTEPVCDRTAIQEDPR